MKLGVGSYTYMWSIGVEGATAERPMDAHGLLERALELGVKVVQYGPNLPLDALTQSQRDSLAKRALELGIEIEVGTRGIEASMLRPQIELARSVGATLLRSIPELAGGATPNRDELVTKLRPILTELKDAGVRLALENSKIPAAELALGLDELSSPWAGVTLDTVNSLAVPEGTREVVKHLARHTFSLHVKDFVVRREWHMMGFVVEGTSAGQGQLDVPWLIAELTAAGTQANAIVELWPPWQQNVEKTVELEQRWAIESIAYLRRLIPD